jgi:hypothetical protein
VERQNLTMRMSMRRFTRFTNAFSKKAENHAVAVALYFMFYNFARVHPTLRVTPAMEAGVSDHVWTIEKIVGLLSKDGQSVARYQRVFKVGSKYKVTGAAGARRTLLCVGRTRMLDGSEHLIFRATKEAAKRRPKAN